MSSHVLKTAHQGLLTSETQAQAGEKHGEQEGNVAVSIGTQVRDLKKLREEMER